MGAVMTRLARNYFCGGVTVYGRALASKDTCWPQIAPSWSGRTHKRRVRTQRRDAAVLVLHSAPRAAAAQIARGGAAHDGRRERLDPPAAPLLLDSHQRIAACGWNARSRNGDLGQASSPGGPQWGATDTEGRHPFKPAAPPRPCSGPPSVSSRAACRAPSRSTPEMTAWFSSSEGPRSVRQAIVTPRPSAAAGSA